MILAPRMIQSMEILQMPIMDLQSEDRAGTGGEPGPGAEGDSDGDQDEARRAGVRPATARRLKHDETRRAGLRPPRRAEQGLGRPLQRGAPPVAQRHRRGEATASTTPCRTWPSRPQSLQDYLIDQLGFLDLTDDQRQLARARHRPHRRQRLSRASRTKTDPEYQQMLDDPEYKPGRPIRRRDAADGDRADVRRAGDAGRRRGRAVTSCRSSTRPASGAAT